jgi:hypothetical protein
MDWQAIGAVGEILGAVAVVVSVVYLAVQVRESTRSTRALLLQGLHSAGAGLEDAMLADASLLKAFRKGCAGEVELNADERDRFHILLSKLFNNYELYFMLSRESDFPTDVTEAHQRIVASRMQFPGVRVWWQSNPDAFSKEFAGWVNSFAPR